MPDILLQFIQHYTRRFPFPEHATDALRAHLAVVQFPKNHVLFQENKSHDYAYFMVAGAARGYYLKAGVEVNTWFAFEQEMVGSLHVYKNLPSRETVALLEDATLVSINLRTLRPSVHHDLHLSNFVAAVVEEYAQFLEDRIYYSQFMTAAERYDMLLKHEAKVVQRVPLTYIASYLGISRETLSRLRGK